MSGKLVMVPCEFSLKGHCCEAPARFLVMTQIPPYTQARACEKHLLVFVDRLLGTEHCPVIICRIRQNDWTWS